MYATFYIQLYYGFSGVGNTKSGRYQIPPNMMIPNHHKRKTWLEHGQENKGSNVAKNQKLNVEDHIASTPTGPRKKTYPRVGS